MDIVNTLMAWLATFGIILIIILIGVLIVNIILQVIFLMIGIKAVKGDNRKFGPVFVTTLLNFLVGLIPCIGCFLAWLVISKRHNVTYGKGFLAWLIAIIVPMLISVGIILLLTLIPALGFTLPI